MSARNCPAHPRSRGENHERRFGASWRGGSSPLTRGKPRRARMSSHFLRLIPAHAGKTPRPLFRGLVSPAHPRSRGENVSRTVDGIGTAGSSPLTRGKPATVTAMAGALGLIPAHAGKTSDRDGHGRGARAHPRSRGENQGFVRLGDLVAGSSPLTRGKHEAADDEAARVRLIPAHAGKTLRSQSKPDMPGAHPRSRGENHGAGQEPMRSYGSSPLTRGKPPQASAGRTRRGLIPAHAGKTVYRLATDRTAWAHPRSRGENAAH